MSDELKACPFCEKEMSDKNFFSCDGYPQACGCWETTHTGEEAVNVWNTRPLEDTLRADKERAEAQVDQMRVDMSNGYDNEIWWRKRAERLEAKLAECHRLSVVGGAKFGVVKDYAEWLIVDNDRLEAMVERFIEAGDALVEQFDPECETEQSTVWQEIAFERKGEK